MICALVIVFVGSVAMAGGVENTVAFLRAFPDFCREPSGVSYS
ncbi:MAG: hypothetical protein ACLT98_13085 [Eggerthellaceae bacterium]